MDAAERRPLLHRLLPIKGWPLHPAAVSGGPCGPAESAWLPLPSQRAKTAKMVLEQVGFSCLSLAKFGLHCVCQTEWHALLLF